MKKNLFFSFMTLPLIVESIAVGVILPFVYIFSSWFLNDEIAFNLTASDWNKIATERLIFFIIFAALIAFGCFIMNRNLYIKNKQKNFFIMPFIISLIVFFIISAASVMGVIKFASEHPFI